MKQSIIRSFFATLLILFSMAVFAADGAPDPEKKLPSVEKEQAEQKISELIQVLGSVENARKTPGSAHFVTAEELEQQENDDIHRVLRQIPGINIQEEDGYGLRPNIGMRGTGVERSQKITLMEDGVLIAPAPYTAPSAYYFPTTGRMEGVEVQKGTSSVKQGPYTNGGSLNLVTTSIPGDFEAGLKATGGSNNTQRYKAFIGDSGERFGWLVEGYDFNTDGFKDLDGGGKTGTHLKDYNAKLRFSSSAGASIYQFVELKLGKAEQFGHETYLGLSQEDFDADPYRRYAASANDTMDTDHEQVLLRYFIKPSDNLDLMTTVYNIDFYRNWFKLGHVNGVSGATVLNNPGDYATEIGILRGDIDSGPEALRLRNNRRNYESRGIQSVLHWELTGNTTAHEIEVGLRYHEDEEDRFQDEQYYSMLAGELVLDRIGAPGSQANRVSGAEATAIFLQDNILIGNWSIKPGLRFESIDYTRTDYSGSDPERVEPTRIRKNSSDVFLPGLGVDYQISTATRVFGGVHRGFSPPGAGQNEETEEELSTNFEFGFRHHGKAVHAEVIGFYNDYDNLLGTETVAGGGESGNVYNGGEVEVQGIEAAFGYDFGGGKSFGLPFNLSYTYTQTEFLTSFETSFPDWGPSVVKGDELPYIPEQQLTASLGLDLEKWSFLATLNYVGDVRTKAGQGAIPENEIVEAHTVTDLSVFYRGFEKVSFFAHVRNLTDEVYVASRRPYGLRPGLSRSFMFGVSANF